MCIPSGTCNSLPYCRACAGHLVGQQTLLTSTNIVTIHALPGIPNLIRIAEKAKGGLEAVVRTTRASPSLRSETMGAVSDTTGRAAWTMSCYADPCLYDVRSLRTYQRRCLKRATAPQNTIQCMVSCIDCMIQTARPTHLSRPRTRSGRGGTGGEGNTNGSPYHLFMPDVLASARRVRSTRLTTRLKVQADPIPPSIRALMAAHACGVTPTAEESH
jgi:hypothetical protein